MKRILKISLALVFMATIVLLNYNTSYAALGEGITAIVTSSIPNGSEVKTGEKITYTIKLKNNSKTPYMVPILFTQLPEGTEYVSATVNPNPADYGVDEDIVTNDGDMVGIVGFTLLPDEEIVYSLTVKVTEGWSGEINYANKTGEDNEDDEPGMAMYIIFLFDENTEPNIEDVLNKISEADTLKEAQNSVKDVAYVDVITQKQTHKVLSAEEIAKKAAEEEVAAKKKAEEEAAAKRKAEEEAAAKNKAEEEAAAKRKAEEEAAAKKKAEEEAAAKKKAEEEAAAKKKAEEAKPVVKETKPIQLPKTGNEVNVLIVSFGILMIMAGAILIIKK